MARPAPADIPEIYAQQPQPGSDPFGDLMVLRDIQPDLSGMDFIYPSGIDIGAIDTPNAVTLLSQADQNAMAALQAEARKVLDQEKAAQTYAELVLGKQPTTAEEFADIEKAKQALIDLGVSREQIEAATVTDFFGNEKSVDTSQGISGVMGPTIKGAIDIAGDFAVDKFGTAALQALGAYGELFGADKNRLLQDTRVGVNPIGPGISYIFGDDGKVRTTPIGTTSTGNPVVLSGPIGAAGAVFGDILRGDVDIFGIPGAIVGAVGGLGGAVQTAAQTGALGYRGEEGEDTEGVFLDEQAILASILNGDDPTKETKTTDQVTVDPNKVPITVDPNAGDPIGPVLVAGSDQLPPVDRVSLPGAEVPVDRVSLPEAQVPVDRVSLPEAQVAVERTSLPEAVVADILASERTDPTRTALPEPTRTSAEVAAAGGGGGGGGGTTAPSGGIRTVSGGPGPSVDIDYLYDFAKGLEQPFQATEEEEEDIVRVAEGGMIGGTDDFERILRILRGM